MALQDLTPQLRTRLNRMEWAVGWFLFLATALLLFGFGFYLYKTAESRGWFKPTAVYYTYADSGDGLSVGDQIKLMGFKAGQITRITATRPWSGEPNVYIEFEVQEPYYGYLWTEGSKAELADAGFLGKRELDLTKGTGGHATYLSQAFHDKLTVQEAEGLSHPEQWRLAEEIYNGTNLEVIEVKAWQTLSAETLRKISSLGITTIRAVDTSVQKRYITAVWSEKDHGFVAFNQTNIYGLPQDETPALTERAKQLVSEIEAALPDILALTNQISTVLSNTANLTSNLNAVAENTRPAASNLAVITAQLREPKGSLGEWLFPADVHEHLDATLQNANVTITNTDTNLVALTDSLLLSLNNLANITSNLNAQVQVNSNMLKQISDIVVHSDDFVQGLKRHWLLRSAFKTKDTNAPPVRSSEPFLSPRAKEQ